MRCRLESGAVRTALCPAMSGVTSTMLVAQPSQSGLHVEARDPLLELPLRSKALAANFTAALAHDVLVPKTRASSTDE
jgi:hypothetical protein